MTKENFKLVFIYKSVYGDNTAGYGIYLINYSDTNFKVHYETNGFITIDNETHKLNGSEHDLKELKANSRILIEENDIGALDMNGYIHLTLTSDIKIKIDFDIGKGAPKGDKINLEGFIEEGIIMDYTLKIID